LQPLILTELDENINGPFIEIIMSADANFTSTANTWKEKATMTTNNVNKIS